MWSMKNVAVLMEDGVFALFFRPPLQGIWQLKNTCPQEFAIQGKKMLMPGGQLRRGGGLVFWGWAHLELTDA